MSQPIEMKFNENVIKSIELELVTKADSVQ